MRLFTFICILLFTIFLIILLSSLLCDNTSTIHDLADKLAEMFYHGRHTYVVTESDNPREMVREYLLITYEYDEEEVKAYEFIWWSTEVYADERIAGFLTFDTAIQAVTEGTLYLDGYENNWHNRNRKRRRRAQAIMKRLRTKGVFFGFDGFWQNACAAPTPMVLIIDKKDRFVYGIDLNPCLP